MSRVGKKPIPIPANTKVSYDDAGLVVVKGEKGTLERRIHPMTDMVINDGIIHIQAKEDTRKARAFQGLIRSLVSNMVQGVSAGFEKKLEINGIGYRVELNGNTIVLNIGYSNPITYNIPEGISAVIEKNNIIKLSGIDKERLGHAAADIKKIRPVEAYKGKGIKYLDEFVQRKAGKAGAK